MGGPLRVRRRRRRAGRAGDPVSRERRRRDRRGHQRSGQGGRRVARAGHDPGRRDHRGGDDAKRSLDPRRRSVRQPEAEPAARPHGHLRRDDERRDRPGLLPAPPHGDGHVAGEHPQPDGVARRHLRVRHHATAGRGHLGAVGWGAAGGRRHVPRCGQEGQVPR